jgi:hypothetical protein
MTPRAKWGWELLGILAETWLAYYFGRTAHEKWMQGEQALPGIMLVGSMVGAFLATRRTYRLALAFRARGLGGPNVL